MSQSGILNDAVLPPGAGVQTLTGNDDVVVGPSAANNINIVGAAGVNVTGNAGTNTLTINITDEASSWVEVTGTSQSMAVNTGYIANNAGLVTLTMPALAAQGSIIRVTGKGVGGWSIAQNLGQQIHFGALSTTSGAGGSLSSNQQFDGVELLCITANTTFNVLSAIGNLTVV